MRPTEQFCDESFSVEAKISSFFREKKISKANLGFFAGEHLPVCGSGEQSYDTLFLIFLNGKRGAPQEA